MSAAVFADTFYFLALLNRRDPAHARAVGASRIEERRFLTTAYVLLELGDALAKPSVRAEYLALHDAVSQDPAFTVLPADRDLFAQGLALYRERPDKEWSLTDCISFAVMLERGLTEALTGDRHFEQAGFRAILV
ncbi:MAG: uncharacterized protein QOE70_883 [Chthoniobacter sp.]|jgi:predicted nucleic acid-binding protein|nr:uncharacterized protein [Chthoniobacter sp.]